MLLCSRDRTHFTDIIYSKCEINWVNKIENNQTKTNFHKDSTKTTTTTTTVTIKAHSQ